MATLAPSDINTKPIPAGDGCAVVYDGKVAGTAASADVLRFCRIPAGTRLAEVSIRVKTAFAGTAPCTLRLSPVDGTTATELVAAGDTVFATVNKKDMAFEPVTVAKDSFLEALLGTLVTPVAGEATLTALGMANGAA